MPAVLLLTLIQLLPLSSAQGKLLVIIVLAMITACQKFHDSPQNTNRSRWDDPELLMEWHDPREWKQLNPGEHWKQHWA